MNNYPVWWDTTITIFNRFEDKQTNLIKWYKYTLNDCFWKYVGDKINIGSTVIETNNIICRIPKNNAYLDKYKWLDVPNDKMSNYFTLGVGDIIVKGIVDDEISEYTKGQHSSDIVAKYKALQGCLTVTEFAVNIGDGRCNEHYRVKGV